MERFSDIHVISFDYENFGLNNLGQFPDMLRFYNESRVASELNIPLFYINTCNRTEFLYESSTVSSDKILQFFQHEFNLSSLEKVDVYAGEAALGHFFNMTAGLKSMALGETQITGQIKKGYKLAKQNNSISKKLDTIISKALEIQKAVRSKTSIGESAISLISLLENEMQNRNLTLSGLKHGLIGGTGDMSEKVARYLVGHGMVALTLLRHNIQRSLPQYFEQLKENITINQISWHEIKSHNSLQCDIFISSAQSEEALLDATEVKLMREQGILTEEAIIVDLAMPVNIDISDASLADKAKYIDLQCLLEQSSKNRQLRLSQLSEAQSLIANSIQSFWLESVFKNNSEKVSNVNHRLQQERNTEWENLMAGPLQGINAKHKRILFDYIIKHEKKSLKMQKDLIAEMLASASV